MSAFYLSKLNPKPRDFGLRVSGFERMVFEFGVYSLKNKIDSMDK